MPWRREITNDRHVEREILAIAKKVFEIRDQIKTIFAVDDRWHQNTKAIQMGQLSAHVLLGDSRACPAKKGDKFIHRKGFPSDNHEQEHLAHHRLLFDLYPKHFKKFRAMAGRRNLILEMRTCRRQGVAPLWQKAYSRLAGPAVVGRTDHIHRNTVYPDGIAILQLLKTLRCRK